MPSPAGAHAAELEGHIPRAAETVPEHKGPLRTDTTAPGQGQGQKASGSASVSGHVGAFDRSALKGLKLKLPSQEAADGDKSVGKAKEALAAAVRGFDAIDYNTLQAVSTKCSYTNS